jgi:hypothetical protein
MKKQRREWLNLCRVQILILSFSLKTHTHSLSLTHTPTHTLSIYFSHTLFCLFLPSSLTLYLSLSHCVLSLTHTHFIYIGASHSSKVNYDKAIKEFFWKCSKPSEIGIQHFVSKPSKGGWQLYVLQSIILYLLWIKHTLVKLYLNSKAVQIN